MRHKAGFEGHDSMREKAERMFRHHLDNPGMPECMPSKKEVHVQNYKKGGHVKRHPLNKEQKDLHIPKHCKVNESPRKRFNLGGEVGSSLKLPFEIPKMPVGISPMSNMRKGGNVKSKYAAGGNVYERMMVGEHPSRSPKHFNYESIMKGEHGRKAQGMAMGGVGKIRHKQATSKGMPKGRREG